MKKLESLKADLFKKMEENVVTNLNICQGGQVASTYNKAGAAIDCYNTGTDTGGAYANISSDIVKC